MTIKLKQLIDGINVIIFRIRFGYLMQPKIQDTITLERMIFTDQSTVGELIVDGELFCYTLEDTCRSNGEKIYGKTAIPSGKYEVVITQSERFKRPLPQLLNVPGFEGVRIHPGNTAEDTEGCILVGMRKATDAIYDSKVAFERVFSEITDRLKKGRLYISILGGKSSENYH